MTAKFVQKRNVEDSCSGWVICARRVVVGDLRRRVAAQRRDAPREQHDDAVAAGVDDAGLAQRRKQVGAAAHGLLAGDDRALQDVSDAPVLLGEVAGRQTLVGAVRELHRDGRRHVAHHRQDRPLSGLAHRRVGALRAARHRRADEHRVDELSGARDELLGGTADQLREDDAAVAASAEQRGARDGVDDLRPPDVVERAIVADLGETLDLGQAGVEREHHVVARIAVGDGKDVEIVDLLPARLEVRERALKAGAEADEAGRRVRRGHARSRVMPSRRRPSAQVRRPARRNLGGCGEFSDVCRCWAGSAC